MRGKPAQGGFTILLLCVLGGLKNNLFGVFVFFS